MAVSFVAASGNITITAPAGVNSTLKVTVTSGFYHFDLTGEVWSISGGDAGNWNGNGTASTAGLVSTVTGTITIDLGDGTNVLNIQSLSTPLTFTPSAGTNTINVSSTAPTNNGNTLNVTADVTVTPTGGSTSIGIGGSTSTNITAITVSSTAVTGVFGTSPFHSLNYSAGGGSLTALTVNTLSSSATPDTVTVTGTGCPLTVTQGSGADICNVQAVSHVSTFNGGAGNDIYVMGTAAGSSAGCDAIAAALTIAAGSGTNNIRIDDTGSATGNKTVTITPASTQAGSATVTGLGSSTITYTANGGDYSAGLRFDGSSQGNVTFTIAADFLDNTVINGNGGVTNTLDLTALTGYTRNHNSDGTGTVTLSNGKTITYSGIIASSRIKSAPRLLLGGV